MDFDWFCFVVDYWFELVDLFLFCLVFVYGLLWVVVWVLIGLLDGGFGVGWDVFVGLCLL